MITLMYFKPDEFAEPERVSSELLERLDAARAFAGVPFYVTSDFRDGDDGTHGCGDAVDISDNKRGGPCGSRWRYHAVRGLIQAGFSRIGVYDRHIHVDVGKSDPEVMWWAMSK